MKRLFREKDRQTWIFKDYCENCNQCRLLVPVYDVDTNEVVIKVCYDCLKHEIDK